MPIILENAELLSSLDFDDLFDAPSINESFSSFGLDLEGVDSLLDEINEDFIETDTWSKKEPFEASNYVFNHDCMWNGHCGSKDHPNDDFLKPCLKPLIPPSRYN